MQLQSLKWTFQSPRNCEAGGGRLLGASDPPVYGPRVSGGRFHLSGCFKTCLKCVTARRRKWDVVAGERWRSLRKGNSTAVVVTLPDFWCCEKIYRKQLFLHRLIDRLCGSCTVWLAMKNIRSRSSALLCSFVTPPSVSTIAKTVKLSESILFSLYNHNHSKVQLIRDVLLMSNRSYTVWITDIFSHTKIVLACICFFQSSDFSSSCHHLKLSLCVQLTNSVAIKLQVLLRKKKKDCGCRLLFHIWSQERKSFVWQDNRETSRSGWAVTVKIKHESIFLASGKTVGKSCLHFQRNWESWRKQWNLFSGWCFSF